MFQQYSQYYIFFSFSAAHLSRQYFDDQWAITGCFNINNSVITYIIFSDSDLEAKIP